MIITLKNDASQKLIQQLLGEAPYPALQRELGIFAAHVHRVELHTARLMHIVDPRPFRLGSQQSRLNESKFPQPVCVICESLPLQAHHLRVYSFA